MMVEMTLGSLLLSNDMVKHATGTADSRPRHAISISQTVAHENDVPTPPTLSIAVRENHHTAEIH
jgi:hypothetical protein